MTLTSAADLARARDLRRVKALATAALAACLGLLIVARMLSTQHPAFGYVAAFAEAATIGGLADWYAVVALFRRPLGLPIPHTAIIERNQDRIAAKLGEFVETNFLDAAPVDAKLRSVDFAGFIADWLRDERRSAGLSRFVLRLLPEALAAAETSGAGAAIARRLLAQLRAIDPAPLIAGALRDFIKAGKHRALLDELLRAGHEALNEPDTLAAIRTKIRDELPTLLRLYRADAYLLKKVAASATSFFEDVRQDPDHAFRSEIDRLLLSTLDRLESERALSGRLDELKNGLLDRPELAGLIRNFWAEARAFIDSNISGESRVLETHLARMFVAGGDQIAADEELRASINQGFVTVLRAFIAEQKSGVSVFIADQVKAWDMRQLIALIETNVGHDLQYIRFNGMLIGGLAGLVLHTLEVLLRL
jgi:uncharacterized membrane-anchored protein YjiN (DUF445 family)